MSLLKKGDTIGLIAPSSGLGNVELAKLIAALEKAELKVVVADNVNDKFRYMAGSDTARAKAFNKMAKNPKVKALLCLRGGAGSTRMLDLVDFNLLKANPKPIIGLSDSTALQNAAFTLSKNISLSGFLAMYDYKMGKIDSVMLNELTNVLFNKKHLIHSGKCLRSGTAEGKLVGGCLSVFNLLCGTRYFPDLSNKILLLEDVGEKTYKIDLMMTQLRQQKGFSKLRGIVFGSFSNCIIKDQDDGTINDCINDMIKDLNIPVISDFGYGHIAQRHILPLGARVKIVASSADCSIKW